MQEPALPANEAGRLAALYALRILDTPPEERFQRIIRTAQRLFDVPMVFLSLVDQERQWFKAQVGLDERETPRQTSFCGHAILQEDPLVIPNAKEDPRFADNPLVTQEPHIRFYAGHPIQSAEGYKLGTLCIIDNKPRQITPEELEALRDLALMAESELNAVELNQALTSMREAEEKRRESEIRYQL